jgi:hypothetical protein
MHFGPEWAHLEALKFGNGDKESAWKRCSR